jgi:hypothetical protein
MGAEIFCASRAGGFSFPVACGATQVRSPSRLCGTWATCDLSHVVPLPGPCDRRRRRSGAKVQIGCIDLQGAGLARRLLHRSTPKSSFGGRPSMIGYLSAIKILFLQGRHLLYVPACRLDLHRRESELSNQYRGSRGLRQSPGSQGRLSPPDRFVIAFHSPAVIFETGLLGCPSEKKATNRPSSNHYDIFSGPVRKQQSRNCAHFPQFL